MSLVIYQCFTLKKAIILVSVITEVVSHVVDMDGGSVHARLNEIDLNNESK